MLSSTRSESVLVAALLGLGLGVSIGCFLASLRTAQLQQKLAPAAAAASQRSYVGVDLGATTVSVGLVSCDGTLEAHVQENIGSDRAAAAITALIARLVRRVLEERPGAGVAAVGIGCPGSLDIEHGASVCAPALLERLTL